MSLVEVKDVSYGKGRKQIIKGLNFQLEAWRFWGKMVLGKPRLSVCWPVWLYIGKER